MAQLHFQSEFPWDSGGSSGWGITTSKLGLQRRGFGHSLCQTITALSVKHFVHEHKKLGVCISPQEQNLGIIPRNI